MKNIILVIKGFLIGLANIIPGVSGGTLAITLGIYDRLINTISNIFTDIKKNIKFLLPIGIGMILSILTLSHLISYCLDNYVFPTVLFFIGTIIGGIPMLFGKMKNNKIKISNILVFLITFMSIILLTIFSGNNIVLLDNINFISIMVLFMIGIISAATMVIPGVSGSAILMTLGYYEPIINVIKDLTNFNNLVHNLIILIPFGVGVAIGILLIAKLISYLFKNHETKTYYGILGFIIASIFSIIFQNLIGINYNIITIILGIILFCGGFVIAYKLGDK